MYSQTPHVVLVGILDRLLRRYRATSPKRGSDGGVCRVHPLIHPHTTN
ncbi:MAG: hypothetical protein J6C86_09420 [Bacteroidaceae bacterium]|nr:hypothetical protein [Bacteroidaceae bacterium]